MNFFDEWSKSYSKFVNTFTKPYLDFVGTGVKCLVVFKKPLEEEALTNDHKVDVFGYSGKVFESKGYSSYEISNFYIKYPAEFFSEGKRVSEMEMEEIMVYYPMEINLKVDDIIIDFKQMNEKKLSPIVLQVSLIKSNYIGKFILRKIALVNRLMDYEKELQLHIKKYYDEYIHI